MRGSQLEDQDPSWRIRLDERIPVGGSGSQLEDQVRLQVLVHFFVCQPRGQPAGLSSWRSLSHYGHCVHYGKVWTLSQDNFRHFDGSFWNFHSKINVFLKIYWNWRGGWTPNSEKSNFKPSYLELSLKSHCKQSLTKPTMVFEMIRLTQTFSILFMI